MLDSLLDAALEQGSRLVGHAGDPIRLDCMYVCEREKEEDGDHILTTDLLLKDERQGESDGLQEQQHAEDTEELQRVEMVRVRRTLSE